MLSVAEGPAAAPSPTPTPTPTPTPAPQSNLIGRLPAELVVDILSRLTAPPIESRPILDGRGRGVTTSSALGDAHGRASPLGVACGVSSAWRALAEPLLYASVGVTRRNAQLVLPGLLQSGLEVKKKSPEDDVDADVGAEEERKLTPRLWAHTRILDIVSLPDTPLDDLLPVSISTSAPTTCPDPALSTLELEHLIIHPSALWTLSTSPLLLAQLTNLRVGPRTITMHLPTAIRAAYLRSRVFSSCCPGCCALAARMGRGLLVLRPPVPDPMTVCAALLPPAPARDASRAAQSGGRRREVVLTGITNENLSMFDTLHNGHRASSCPTPIKTDPTPTSTSPAPVDAPAVAITPDCARTTLGADPIDSRSYDISLAFAPCLCADDAFADDYCPNHVSPRCRAEQVARVLHGAGVSVSVSASVSLSMSMAKEGPDPHAPERAQSTASCTVAQGRAGFRLAEEVRRAVARGKAAHSQSSAKTETATATGVAGAVDGAGAERQGDAAADADAEVQLVFQGSHGARVSLRGVERIGWTGVCEEHVRQEIWDRVEELLRGRGASASSSESNSSVAML